MDDFVVALIAVFVVLGILLAASAYLPYYPEGLPEEEMVLHTFSAGTVGYTQNYVSRVQNYGSFGVGTPQDEVLKDVPMMEITAGVFGGEDEEFTVTAPDYVMEWMLSGEMTFRVKETNQLGNLVIEWNGAEIYNKKAYPGMHSIDLRPEQIKRQNTLKIYSHGPGFMFWAASVYKISGLEVSARYGPAKFLDFRVSQDELETLDSFELAWFTKSRRGNLSVLVNGGELFSGQPDRVMTILFTEEDIEGAPIRPGNNRLTFSPINSSAFELEDVLLNTHVSTARKVVRERVDLSASQADGMEKREAKMRLYVEYIDRPGTISIRVNEAGAGSASGKNGWNVIEVDSGLFAEGSNWVEISSTGAFDIGEAILEFA